jgi:hypothetical protein
MSNEAIFFHIIDPGICPSGAQFNNISNIIVYKDNSINHIIVQDLFDYYDEDNLNSTLIALKDKLAPSGILEIQSIDLKRLGIAICFEEVPLNFVQKLLYPNRKSIHTIYDIISLLQKLGFKINNKKYVNNIEYYISAIKL